MRFTLKDECRIVAREMERRFEVPPGSVYAHTRCGRASRARWATWSIIQALHPTLSYSRMGLLFGRNHATVMSGLARYLGGKQGSSKAGMTAMIEQGRRVLHRHLVLEGQTILAAAYLRRAQAQETGTYAIAA
jgi:hypothetical protein